jgi:hypothetical protein
VAKQHQQTEARPLAGRARLPRFWSEPATSPEPAGYVWLRESMPRHVTWLDRLARRTEGYLGSVTR